MKFTIVTLFPEFFVSVFKVGILARAIRDGHLSVETVNPRDFALDKHKSVDDTPYGGGPGMVMKVDSLVCAIEQAATPDSRRILLSPVGRSFDHQIASDLADESHVILVCGRYEGVDERVVDVAIDESLSVGDFVMTGGEIAAAAVVDAVVRLRPGVLGDDASATDESFAASLLEYPQYTRPKAFRDLSVPEVLSSGHHEKIEDWRARQRTKRTLRHRPDLLKIVAAERAKEFASRSYLVLAHHPVYDRGGEVITTSITNLDLHDIARSVATYGLGGYYVVTPIAVQREKVERIVSTWTDEIDQVESDSRREALKTIRVAASVEEAELDMAARQGRLRPRRVVTSAKNLPLSVGPEGLWASMLDDPSPISLVFGTGFGLASSIIDGADLALSPILGRGEFNHLSVRSAAAVILDRIFDPS